MSITTVGNQLIHYEVLGRGQPVIFIHSWLGSWRYWWPSMQALAAHHRSFAIDLWGFGDSSKEPSRYNLKEFVTMVDDFRDKLGIMRPAHIVGHGIGAAVALSYAYIKPEFVDKVVTVALPVQGKFVNDKLAALDPENFVSRVLGKANSFSEVDSELRKTDPNAVTQVTAELSGIDLSAAVMGCKRPLLMLYGEKDIVVQPPTGEYAYLQRQSNNRYYVTLDSCSHFPMLEEKIKFNRLLLDFLLTADEDLTQLQPKEHWQRRVR